MTQGNVERIDDFDFEMGYFTGDDFFGIQGSLVSAAAFGCDMDACQNIESNRNPFIKLMIPIP